MQALSFTLLGELQIEQNGELLTAFTTDKARALLIYLTLERQPHSRSALARLLWPGYSEQSARNNLRQTLFELRQVLRSEEADSPWLLSSRLTLQLNPRMPVTVDVQQFTSLIEACAVHDHDQLERCTVCLERLQQAADLYRGDFLAHFIVDDSAEFEEWRCILQEQLHLQAVDLFETLANAAELARDTLRTQQYIEAQLQLEPWLESAHRRMMQLWMRQGQRGSAIAQYHRLRQILEAELGVEPEPRTVELYEQIRMGTWGQDKPGAGNPSIAPAAEQIPADNPASPRADTQFASLQTSSPLSFVAREYEVERLQTFLTRALAGQGQIVLVQGEAGSGKTTLLRAFAQQAQAAYPDLIVAESVCNAYTGAGDPYLLFRELANLLSGGLDAGDRDGFGAEEQARRLRTFGPIVVPTLVEHSPLLLDHFVPSATLLAYAETFANPQAPWLQKLAARVGRQQTDEMPAVVLEQQQLFAQYLELLQRLAAQRPLLLILDDLHWIDPSSLNLLFFLVRKLTQSRVLFIGSCRSEVLDLDVAGKPHPLIPVFAEFKRSFGDIVIDLDKTTEERGRQFVDALLDNQPNQLDEAFRQALFHHTAGQPLFTAELMRHLQTQGDLQQNEAGLWIEAAPLNWPNMPARIEGVIEQWINQLTPALRQILQVASVEGEEFTAEVVARVQGVRERELVQQLGEVLERRHRLVSFVGLTWVGTQRLSHYRFRHNLFQKYLYHNLDAAEKAYLHADLVGALEALYAEQIEHAVVPLARHCKAAGLLDQAAAYYRQAGQRAQQLSAYPEAIEHFQQGIAILRQLPPTTARLQSELALQLALGNILLAIKGYSAPEVGESFQRALALSQQVGENSESIAVLRGLQRASLASGDWQAARKWGEQLLEKLDAQVEPGARAEAHRTSAVTSFYLGDFTETLHLVEQGIVAYQRQPDYPYLQQFGNHIGVSLYAYRAMAWLMLGYPSQATRQIEQLLDLAHTLNHPFILTAAYGLAASFFFLQRDVLTILGTVEQGMAIAQQQAFDYWVGSLLVERGWALVLANEQSAGLSEIERGLASWRATGQALQHRSEPARHAYIAMLIEVDGLIGEPGRALATLQEVLAEVEPGAHFLEAELHRLRGELLLLDKGSNAEVNAEQAFAQAIAIAQQQQAKLFELRATVSLSQLWQRQGKCQLAQERLATIYAWFSEGFATPDLRAAADLLAALAAA